MMEWLGRKKGRNELCFSPKRIERALFNYLKNTS
jgi:hypothetical protein